MERLTHERSNGIKPGYWSPATNKELVQRLAAYENTGYAPDEITAAIEQARREGETRSDDCLEALQAAMDRLGKFGRLFSDYSGCPRGPMGRMAGVSLVDEALSMDVLVDVDGGRWIPVQADVLRELCEQVQSGKAYPARHGHWVWFNEIVKDMHGLRAIDGCKCSLCGMGSSGRAFCECCGAKMDEEDKI